MLRTIYDNLHFWPQSLWRVQRPGVWRDEASIRHPVVGYIRRLG